MDRYDIVKVIAAWLNDQGYQNHTSLDTDPPYICVRDRVIYCITICRLIVIYHRSKEIVIELANPEALDKLLQAIQTR